MSYSIFRNTMVDMPFTEIEKVAEAGGGIILPVSVVEEHGPHLCTGTDIYLTQTICEKVKCRLEDMGVKTLIAPPFYWGVNSMTNGFAGSFQIRPETMTTLLLEILENFVHWGFQKVFLVNFHGDFKHIKTIMNTVEKANEEKGIPAYFVNDETIFGRLGNHSETPYFIKVRLGNGGNFTNSDTLEIHAGGFETSWMIHSYKDLVNIPVATKLEASHTGFQELMQWANGGETARKLTPQGYFGTPSDIDLEKIEMIEQKTVEVYADAIYNVIH